MYRSNSNNVKRTQRSSTEMIKLQDEVKRSDRTLLEVTEFQLSLLFEFHINFLQIALLRLTQNILSFNIKVKSSNVEGKYTNLSICPFYYKKILIPDIKLHSRLQIIPLNIVITFIILALHCIFFLCSSFSYLTSFRCMTALSRLFRSLSFLL